MKKLQRVLSAALCTAIVGTMVPTALAVGNNTADGTGPVSSENTELKWRAGLGSGMTPLTMAAGGLYTAAGSTLYKISPSDGSYDSATLDGALADAEDALTVADGKVFVPIEGGRIQAFDADSLQSLWISESREGEITTAITYADGKLYAGSGGGYIGMTASDDDTSSTEEEKAITWSTAIPAGSDVYASDGAVVFGGADSKLYSFSADNAEQTLDATQLDSAADAALICVDGVLYFTTEDGILYRIPLQSGGALGEAHSLSLGSEASDPTIVDDRIYVGVNNAVKVLSYDEDGLENVYTVEADGFVQAAPLAVTGGDETQIYYTTLNSNGKLYSFADSSDGESAEAEVVYTPENGGAGGMAVRMDSEGSLYYQTEDGSIFAVKEKPEDEDTTTPVISKISGKRKLNDTGKASIKLNASKKGTLYYVVTDEKAEQPDVFGQGSTVDISRKGSRSVTVSGIGKNRAKIWFGLMDAGGTKSEIKSISLEQVVTATVKVTPKKAALQVKSGSTKITAKQNSQGKYSFEFIVGTTYKMTASCEGYESTTETVTAKADKKSYTIELKSKNSKLSYLSVSDSLTNQTANFTLSPSFQTTVTEYTAKTNANPNTVYLWVRAADDKAKLKVYGKSGVDPSGMSQNKKIKGESYGGYQRYAVRLKPTASHAKLVIEVKSDSGVTGTYTVKVVKADKVAPIISNVTSKTRRAGISAATLVLKSSEQAKGYLKIASIGTVPKNIVEEGYSFNIKKGETVLNITGISTIARNFYIVAVDEAGNRSGKLKIYIPAYTANKNQQTTGGNSSRPVTPTTGRSSTLTPTTPSSGSRTTANSPTNGTNTTTAGTDGTTNTIGGTTTGTDGLNDVNGSGYGNGTTLYQPESYDDTIVVDDAAADAEPKTVEVGSAGSVPANSVIHSGFPTWIALLVIIVACAAGLGGYALFLKRKELFPKKTEDDKPNDNN